MTATEPTAEQSQLSLLLPGKPFQFTNEALRLDELPPDEVLIGPPPGAAILEQTRQLLAIIEPIIVERVPGRRRKGERYVVRRGRRRIKAARAVVAEFEARGEEPPALLVEIPARVMAPAKGFGGLLLDVNAHASRKENPAAEVVAIRRLMEEGFTEKDIAAATGLALGVVRKRLELTKLIKPLWEAMCKGKIGTGVAEACAPLPKEVQQRLAKHMKAEGRLTMPDVTAAKRARRDDGLMSLDFGSLGGTGTGGGGGGGGGGIKPADGQMERATILKAVGDYLTNNPGDRSAFLGELATILASATGFGTPAASEAAAAPPGPEDERDA